MCIMEIHAKASNPVMLQAMAHNTKTVRSDVDMLIAVLDARHAFSAVRDVREAAMFLDHAYGLFLAQFGMFAAQVVPSEIHSHDNHGHERTLDQVVQRAIRNAAKDETR